MPIDPYTGEEIGNLSRLTVRPNQLPVEAYDAATGMAYPDQPQQDYSAVSPSMARLLGVGGYDRFQTWPERMVRSGASLPADVYSGEEPILDANGHTAQKVIERAQDTSGMAGMSSIPLAPKGALGALGGKFYSTLENTIANSKVQKGTPEQWQAYLKNQPGVKPEELEFSLSGLGEGIVTKEQLVNHVTENGIKLGEVWKGDKTVNPKLLELDNQARAFEREGNTEAAHAVRQEILGLESDGVGRPKFSSYQLPGGENYRELLLTTPTPMKEYNTFVDGLRAKYGEGGLINKPLTEAERTRLDHLQEKAGDDGVKPYQSSHWDEPNVLAHIRMNDRFIPDPTGPSTNSYNTLPKRIGEIKPDEKGLKTLHIEEIQSDWHQAGRKQGYSGDETKVKQLEQKIKVKDADGYTRTRLRQNGFDLDKIANEDLYTYGDKGYSLREPANTQTLKDWNSEGVPNAPFKKTWDELALKRAITEAAHNGYDAVSWTPGEAQAARYDLSKHVKEIEYIKNQDGTYKLGVTGKNGDGVDIPNSHSMTLQQIENTVGKEIAEKIKNGDGKKYRGHEGYSLEGLDLKVGGEGMKAFYDTMLPAKANALIKKMGGKVEYQDIPLPNSKFNISNSKIPIIRITPQMREKITKEGFPLYSSGVPNFTPVDDPFKKKEPKLVPVDFNPFTNRNAT